MNKYPKIFPENFERDILPKGAEFSNREVYRIIKNGTIDRDSFISTFEETERGLRPKPKRNYDLEDPGIYSTSCNEDYNDACYLLKVFMRHYPKPKIAIGVTEKSCGPSQLTSERTKNMDSHVDWWIFDEANPQCYFKEVNENEE